MKNLTGVFLSAIALVVVIGCGLAKDASDTLHQTKEMNKKMDKTNTQVELTNSKMDKTNQGIEKTNAAVHTQTLSVALNSLLANENTEVLLPPTDMIPFAAKFVEEATAKEILQTFHLLYTSVMKGFDKEADGDKHLRRREIRMAAASALAALASKEKAKEILDTQINEEGEYIDTAYVFALCRYNFTKSYLLDPVLEPSRTPTLKLLKVAEGHFRVLKELATVPYVAKLSMKIPEYKRIDGGSGKLEEYEDTLNPVEYQTFAKTALRKFEQKLKTSEAEQLLNSFR